MMVSAAGARQEPDSTTGCDAMDALKSANLAVRFLLELCLGALGLLGPWTRSPLLTKVALGVGAPQPLPWGVVVDDQHGPGIS